jgi:ribosomal protein S18 acetylase RimI-like enzyme
MSTIRLMRKGDADAVRCVDSASFGAWWGQQAGETVDVPRRTRANVLACLEKDPEGCFVAEEGERIVGMIFSRTWGGVGWFGTFAVLPEYQGRGIGRQLIAASLEYLRRDAGRVIGLETMPESAYNLGLYLKRGFQPHSLTLSLSKELAAPAAGRDELMCWSQVSEKTQGRWLADLREATGRLCPGLDYSKEVVSTAQHGLGETLVLEDRAQAIGLSTVWLTSSREGWGEERAAVQVLALHPDYTDKETLCALLRATERLALNHGKRQLALPVNTHHDRALGWLFNLGYRVDRAMVRLVLKGTAGGPSQDDLVNLSRWAG